MSGQADIHHGTGSGTGHGGGCHQLPSVQAPDNPLLRIKQIGLERQILRLAGEIAVVVGGLQGIMTAGLPLLHGGEVLFLQPGLQLPCLLPAGHYL